MTEAVASGRGMAEASAAQMFDPVAFAKRLEEARALREVALAQRRARDGLRPSDDPSPEPLPAGPSPAEAPPRPSGRAERAPAAAPRAVEPLVAPGRRGKPQRRDASPRVFSFATLLLLVGAAAAMVGSPGLRERAGDLSMRILASATREPPRSFELARALPAAAQAPQPTPGDAEPPTPAEVGLAPAAATEAPAPAKLAASAPSAAWREIPFGTTDLAARAMPESRAFAPKANPRLGSGPMPDALSGVTPVRAALPVSAGGLAFRPSAPGPAARATPAPERAAHDASSDAPAGAGQHFPVSDASDPPPPSNTSGPILVHAPPTVSDAMLEWTLARLRNAGYATAQGARVPVRIGHSQVRYFHAADAAAAYTLAEALGGARVRDFTHATKTPARGSLKVWLASDATEQAALASGAPAAAASGLAQPVATPPATPRVSAPVAAAPEPSPAALPPARSRPTEEPQQEPTRASRRRAEPPAVVPAAAPAAERPVSTGAPARANPRPARATVQDRGSSAVTTRSSRGGADKVTGGRSGNAGKGYSDNNSKSNGNGGGGKGNGGGNGKGGEKGNGNGNGNGNGGNGNGGGKGRG